MALFETDEVWQETLITMEYIRTFIALDVPVEVKEHISKVQHDLRRMGGARISWTRPAGIHLTLKFLGDVERDRLDEVTKAVRDSAALVNPFKIITTKTGGFPNLRRPRVLWWGLSSDESLMTLQDSVDRNLGLEGFKTDEKRFHPHLTIGRVKYVDRRSEVIDEFSSLDMPLFTWEVRDVRVMSSVLNPQGAEYGVTSTVTLHE